ncbi:hypothetical protein LOC68_26725 [Blastopirellula sp. JC732]|uniref:Uncharacterized protein n=1 Tax=Blastopirellula sediminis TaxID=2894196 RepID=A0A9X1SJI6_9BACT|nr:hypothetical protein [Blastopirellula sediminis]MCC9604695.1 hypothetical protein [Blastopirellula sediminis]MCC9632006.1 hypothetical protein [Blastopirellula sediminis]
MRNRIIQLVAFGLLMIPAAAMAQTVTTYYYGAPTPIIYTPPSAVPVTRYYAPTPVRVYSPYYGSPQPIIYGRPTYQFYSPYGGTEVRVPGQPVLNTLRTIVP